MSTTPQPTTIKHAPGSQPWIQEILSPEVLVFLKELHENFEHSRQKLLESRLAVQQRMDSGVKFEFPERTAHVRSAEWKISPIPDCLRDRRLELLVLPNEESLKAGTTSKAPVLIADFEDGISPTWANLLNGHRALCQWVTHSSAGNNHSVLMIRPRAMHCDESHVTVNNELLSASLFDFGLYFFHNAHQLVEQGQGPFFYLSKLEHYREARWWNDIFIFAQNYFGLDCGTIKATVTVETMPAAFQLDEMLYELRDHSSGLSCGKQNYLFSFIKHFGTKAGYMLPDRDTLSFQCPFLECYAQQIVYVAHRRGGQAIGVTSNELPNGKNEALSDGIMETVIKGKMDEQTQGFDGSRVAHPQLVDPILRHWNSAKPETNNERPLNVQHIGVNQLLSVSRGDITERQIRQHIHVCLFYLASWLSGAGTIEIMQKVEDKTGAELARAQLWQWKQCKARLADGQVFDLALFNNLFDEESMKVRSMLSAKPEVNKYLATASELLLHLVHEKSQTSFITDLAYPLLVNRN